jgi:hypothetical protein
VLCNLLRVDSILYVVVIGYLSLFHLHPTRAPHTSGGPRIDHAHPGQHSVCEHGYQCGGWRRPDTAAPRSLSRQRHCRQVSCGQRVCTALSSPLLLLAARYNAAVYGQTSQSNMRLGTVCAHRWSHCFPPPPHHSSSDTLMPQSVPPHTHWHCTLPSVEIDATDKRGRTAARVAQDHGHVRTANLLFSLGADHSLAGEVRRRFPVTPLFFHPHSHSHCS